MGKIVSDHDFQGVSQANIKAFVKQTTGRYQVLFSSNPPTFVTYYSLSVTDGSVDPSLRGADEIIGKDSPLVYARIDNLPIYSLSQLDLNRDFDDVVGSATGEISGEAYTLPSSIEPRENDYFVLEHTEARHLFRVVSVNVDRIEGIAYHKLSFILDEGMETESRLNDQLTKDGEYEFDMDGVGVDEAPAIIQKVGKRLRNELAAVLDNLKKWYITSYYDENYGALTHTSPDGFLVHDPMLDYFVRKREVFHTNKYLYSLSLPVPDPWYVVNYNRVCGYCVYETTKRREDRWMDRYQMRLIKTATTSFTNPFYGTTRGYCYIARHELLERDDLPTQWSSIGFADNVKRHNAVKDGLYKKPLTGISLEHLFPAREWTNLVAKLSFGGNWQSFVWSNNEVFAINMANLALYRGHCQYRASKFDTFCVISSWRTRIYR